MILLLESNKRSNLSMLLKSTTKELKKEAGCPGNVGNIPLDILESTCTKSWLRSTLIFAAKKYLHSRPLHEL